MLVTTKKPLEAVEAKAQEMLGDALINAHHYQEAREAFKTAGANDRLIELGNRHVSWGWLEEAEACYAAAGQDLPRSKIMQCADALYDRSSFSSAETIYRMLDAKDKLLRCAEHYLASEASFDGIMKLYEELALEPPRTKLLAYAAACLKNGKLFDARNAYQRAKDRDGCLKVAQAFLAKGDYREAKELYGDVKEPIAEEAVRSCAKKNEKENPYLALEAYGDIGDKDGLRRMADHCLEIGWIETAIKAASSAGYAIPRDVLLRHVQTMLKDVRAMERAVKVLRIIADRELNG